MTSGITTFSQNEPRIWKVMIVNISARVSMALA